MEVPHRVLPCLSAHGRKEGCADSAAPEAFRRFPDPGTENLLPVVKA